MPINLPNGNDVEEIVLPNGANASEVYGPNGNLVWTGIPDSDVYLHDDFEDGKIQDREESETTTYNSVEGVYRPEWEDPEATNQDGLPSVESEELLIEQGNAMITPVNINLDETVVWRMELVELDTDNIPMWWSLFAASDTMENLDSFDAGALEEGYTLGIRSDNDMFLRRVDSGHDTTDISSSVSAPSAPAVIEVVREPNGDWDVTVDGSSVASANDDTHDVANYTAFSSRNRTGFEEARIDEIKVS